jgi:AbrB family looped-hinge helix DNA binding protein
VDVELGSTSGKAVTVKELRTVVTRNAQVMVPAELRRKLGLKRGDKVAFVLDESEVRLACTGSVLQRTAGALKSPKPALTAEQLRESAEPSMAEEPAQWMGE